MSSGVEGGRVGAKRAGQRKLQHELGIPAEQVPLDKFHFLTRIHYKAASDAVWGEHESTCTSDALPALPTRLVWVVRPVPCSPLPLFRLLPGHPGPAFNPAF